MTNALDRGIPFNPMRFREEIRGLEFSITKIETLLKQYGASGYKELLPGIKEEAVFLKNLWDKLEVKLQKIEKAETPYYFLKKQTQKKIDNLLRKANKISIRF